MNSQTVYSAGEAIKWRDLREMLNTSEPTPEAAWRASERLENIRSILCTGHNQLINHRVRALYQGRDDVAAAFAIGAAVAREALAILLAEGMRDTAV